MFQNYRLTINKKFSWHGILYVKENTITIKDCDVKFSHLKFFLIPGTFVLAQLTARIAGIYFFLDTN